MYAGASWIKETFGVNMSALGESVANILGRTFAGIYHLPHNSLKRVNWASNRCIEYTISGELATFDFNHLTALVVFTHDEMIRMSMQGVGPGYMKFMFHQRMARTGDISRRIPTIDENIETIRKREWAK